MRRQAGPLPRRLEAGTDPKIVAGWTAEMQARKVYRHLGPKLTYNPGKRTMGAEIALDAQSWGVVCVRRGT